MPSYVRPGIRKCAKNRALSILGKESAAHRPFMYAASAADQCGSARYLVIVLYVGMFV